MRSILRSTLRDTTLRNRFLHTGVLAVAGATLFVSGGCQAMNEGQPVTTPATTRAALLQAAPANANANNNNNAPRPAGEATPAAAVRAPLFSRSSNAPADKMIRGSLAFPTGDARTSAIVLEKAVPSEVVANKAYEYELTVRNVSSTKLENVQVVETMPAGLKLADKVDGAALSLADGKAFVKVGTLNAGESRTLKIGATATQSGAITNCASVTYDASLCVGVNVVSPTLALATLLPADVLVCDKVPLKLTLTNNGTGTARNVKLSNALPEGMTTADGKQAIDLVVGDIASGQSKTVDVPLKILRTGTFSNTAVATADDGLRSEATASLSARQAVLEVLKMGPKQTYVGVPYGYEISVANKGDADAQNVTVVDTLPAGVAVVEASDNGKVADGKVTWTIGRLDKATNKQLKLTVKGIDVGNARNTVSATADCATTATVAADTQLVGIPAILLEVTDNPDPVVVGAETTYTIQVTNQGSAVATNVKLVADLEQQMEYLSSKGATGGKIEGMTVTFEPLATLAPKAKATYTIVVRAKDAGDVRFKTTMTSDQLGRPVDELESTTFYK